MSGGAEKGPLLTAEWLDHALRQVPVDDGRESDVEELRRLFQGWATAFAASRDDVVTAELRWPSRDITGDEARAFLAAVRLGVIHVEDTGHFTIAVRPKAAGGRYALVGKSGTGVGIHLEYLIQVGATGELVSTYGWPPSLLDFERGEFDVLGLDAAGRATLAVEAKCRARGPDSIEKMVREWLSLGRTTEAAPPTNAGRKFNELVRLCRTGPVIVWLVAAHLRWAFEARLEDDALTLRVLSDLPSHLALRDRFAQRSHTDIAPSGGDPAPRQEHDPLRRCSLHEMQNCALCWPAAPAYRRGARLVHVPPGSFVSIRGGRGVYHHADCYQVTGDWDGADTAVLGERVVHAPDEPSLRDLKPADCCRPPLFMDP